MSKEYTDLTEHNHIMAPSPQQAMLIQQAAEFAQQAHHGQIRRGGAPYYTHVNRVAERVESLTADAHLTAAAYLHDTMEDCGVTAADIEARFGLQIAIWRVFRGAQFVNQRVPNPWATYGRIHLLTCQQ